MEFFRIPLRNCIAAGLVHEMRDFRCAFNNNA